MYYAKEHYPCSSFDCDGCDDFMKYKIEYYYATRKIFEWTDENKKSENIFVDKFHGKTRHFVIEGVDEKNIVIVI